MVIEIIAHIPEILDILIMHHGIELGVPGTIDNVAKAHMNRDIGGNQIENYLKIELH